MTGIIHSLIYDSTSGVKGSKAFQNTNNVDLHALFIAALGWNGVSALTATYVINAGVIVGSTNVDVPALTTGAAFPGGSVITIINNGTILGKGGQGGDSNQGVGQHGGLALEVNSPVTIDNTLGVIAGGGGGGGGAAVGFDWFSDSKGLIAAHIYGGSTGGGGIGSGAAGAYVPNASGSDTNAGCNVGTAATQLAAGSGGAVLNSGYFSIGGGGGGGGWGQAGGAAGTTSQVWLPDASRPTYTYPGGAGGAGGTAITGNNLITWTAAGAQYGTVVNAPAGTFAITIAANESNINIRNKVIALGWNGIIPVTLTFTINAGVVISSAIGGVAALDTGLAFPATSAITIVNAGTIEGYGGWGGNTTSTSTGGTGFPGGTALKVNSAVTINNTGGVIAGGGGGGGGGGSSYGLYGGFYSITAGGPGGGGAGASAGLGGGTTPEYFQGLNTVDALPASAGTLTTGGAGGATINSNGAGGAGGNRGVAGSAGSNAAPDLNGSVSVGGAGGAAGNCTMGNALITWAVVGTRLGTLG
jgi:hypothetical protein